MANQVVGTIIAIGDVQNIPTKSGKMFTKRELVLSIRKFDTYTGELYNDVENTPSFTLTGEKAANFNFSVGQTVRVKFELQGRSFPGQDGGVRYFTDVRAYAVDLYGRDVPAAPANDNEPAGPVPAQEMPAPAVHHAAPAPAPQASPSGSPAPFPAQAANDLPF